MQLEVVEAFHFAGTDYTVGQLIDTTTLPPRMVRQLLGRFPVAVAGGGGGGGGGLETDPVAMPALTTHKGSADHDAHNDTRLAPKVHAHTGTYEPSGAVATHAGAVDPHGDRGYADSRIAALVNAAPAALDTLAEIDAQLSSDEAGAAAMQASINQNTTGLTNHINNAAGAHAASAVSVNPSGLIVVTSNNVQGALGQLDAWANARPTNESGLVAALPANGSRPNNSTYFATDLNGGTTYRMVAGAWVQQAPGVNAVAGQELDYSQLNNATFTPVNDNTWQTIPGIQVTVPAGRAAYVTARFLLLLKIGGVAVNADIAISARIVDNGITTVPNGDNIRVFGNGGAVGNNIYNNRTVTMAARIPAPAAATVYICQIQVPAVVPAGQAQVYSFAPYQREMRAVAA